MPLEVAALAPLSVATVGWRDAQGAFQLTVIAKATFEIRPDHRARLVDPYPLFGDVYFEENVGRSLRVASDWAPCKPKVDVLFTGAAYAPVGEHVTHRSIRFAMASSGKSLLDKKLLAVGTRERDKSGTPTPPQPFVYLPLRWELAYGGASSRANPIGVGEDPGDSRLPSIVDASNPKRAAGLGPVPPGWAARLDALGGADPAVLGVPVPTLRAGISFAYFNAAPPDQQLDALRGDEQVLMSGLHPTLADITWKLPGLKAHAVLEHQGARREIPLAIDTLWIEGELLRCTLTWRGVLPLAAAEAAQLDSMQVLATLTKGESAPTWERRPAPRVEAPAMLGTSPGAPEATSIFQRSASIELEIEHSMIYAPKSEKPMRIPRRVTAMPPIVNETGLHAWTIPWQVKPPDHAIVVVVKATYLVGDDGVLRRAPEQDPPSGDVEHEPDELLPAGASSLRYASDFAVFKPAADVLLVGHAYPPDANVGVTNVELRVGNSLRRRLAVFGDRKWGGFGFEGQPARFDKMPLRWERAMGGPMSEDNPVGRGYRSGVAAPNVERPEALVKTRDDRPAPACCAPLSPAWKARRSKTGTYDAAWMKERWPYLPADFDWTHFNAAPPEQQVPYLQGDERFAVVGVRPGGKGFEGRLPGDRPRVFAQRTEEVGADFFEVLLRVDTMWIDGDAGKVVLVWRGIYSTPDDDSPDIAAIFVDVENGETMRPLDDARERFLARVASASLLPLGAMAFPDEPALDPAAAKLPARLAAPPTASVLAELKAGRSLAGRDLSGVDLHGQDLTDADLAGAVLANADLSDALLDGAKLAGAVLVGARADRASFVGTDLAAADLTGARLARARLDGAALGGAVLDGVRAADASFAGVTGDRVSFVGAALEGAVFDKARLPAADFSRADLKGTRLRDAALDDVRLYDVRGDGAAF